MSSGHPCRRGRGGGGGGGGGGRVSGRYRCRDSLWGWKHGVKCQGSEVFLTTLVLRKGARDLPRPPPGMRKQDVGNDRPSFPQP